METQKADISKKKGKQKVRRIMGEEFLRDRRDKKGKKRCKHRGKKWL